MLKIYNEIGKTYNVTRRADPQLLHALLDQLGISSPATILDVGAGTGNFSYELAKMGFQVIALEPSEVMRNQGKTHENVVWKAGAAEAIPLQNESVDAIICILASHHFTDLPQALKEMKRVLRSSGKIVFFTLDVRLCEQDHWIIENFTPILKEAYEIHPPLNNLVTLMKEHAGLPVHVTHFPLPRDLTDHFFFTAWSNPKLFFNEEFQQGTSPLAKADQDALRRCLKRLSADLENGTWHNKYGEILETSLL